MNNTLNVNIKKLNNNAIMPQYAKAGDAGLDLVATEINLTEYYIEYKTGLAFEIPDGYVGLLFSRSSISKKDLILSNAVGIIDSGYRGEVSFRFKKLDKNDLNIYIVGDKIGQIVILPYPKINLQFVETLSNTERGVGGYGSTGR